MKISAQLRLVTAALIPLVLSASWSMAQDLGWQTYRDPELGYRIEIPEALLEPKGEVEGKLLFEDEETGAQLSVYGAVADGKRPEDIAAELEGSDWIEEVTYRQGGSSWFVLSGYYTDAAAGAEDFIFYLKLMMSPDNSHYAVFAISYPQSERDRYYDIVERIEDSFRGPA